MKQKAIIAVCICLSACMQLGAQTYEEWCDRAASAIGHDSLPQAEVFIRKALAKDPANPHNALLFSNLGYIQRSERKYQEALRSYELALNIAPRNVPILLNRAALCMELGDYDQAQVDYSLVLDLQPANREALLMRAYIHRQRNDYRSARADYDSLLSHTPQDFEGRLGLAMLEQKEKHYDAASALLTRMIDEKAEGTSLLTSSQHAVVYVARAGVEKDKGNNDRALTDLNEAIRLDANLSEAYLVRGQIYLLQQKKELARQDFERAASLGIPMAELSSWLKQCK